ncbi:MAG TPA: histidine kinase dimerization/phospho-acceptor domain-containing protein, partial [Nitrososphaeraceae archaeon]|nr:histidine kinase dimerization/phospho-acceptor domain-containing protein [Nitrososphaeraceae archaeon]
MKIAYLRNTLFSPKTRGMAVTFTIAIIVISYSLFFYLQSTTESDIRNSIFEQQKARQMQSTQTLSQRISSDLGSIMTRLQGLTVSSYLQQADLSSDKTRKLLQETYFQINNITTADRLFIINKNCVVMTYISLPGRKTFVGANASGIEWVRQITIRHKPVFTNGYFGFDGDYRITIAYPIINRETREYMGLVGSSVPATQLFEHYGNILDIKSQYLAVLDGNSNQLIHPVKSLIGKPFFGSYTQQVTGYNKALNSLIRTVMDGRPDFAVYPFKNGERLSTGFPIFVEGKPTYFVFVITPTSVIYSQINEVISTERLEMFSLIAGSTAAIVILVIFLIRWSNTLDNEVKKRTRELDKANNSLTESNKQLALANEQLKIHDTMQRDFINIAAHELRTPVQPILTLTRIIQDRMSIKKEEGRVVVGKAKEQEQIELCQLQDVVISSAKRLQKLTDDILDVSRIESHRLTLQKERFDINDVILNIIQDCKKQQLKRQRDSSIAADGLIPAVTNLTIVYKGSEKQEGPIFVEADKQRISQVV